MTYELLDEREELLIEQINDAVLGHLRARGAQVAFEYDDRRQANYDAHAAEYILARSLGEQWNTLDHLDQPGYVDVGTLDEVRHSPSGNAHLILYPADTPDLRFHLYGGTRPRYIHRGWMWGREGKEEQYWVTAGDVLPGTIHVVRRSGFFLPQHHLRRLSELLPPPPPPEPEPEPVQPSTMGMFFE